MRCKQVIAVKIPERLKSVRVLPLKHPPLGCSECTSRRQSRLFLCHKSPQTLLCAVFLRLQPPLSQSGGKVSYLAAGAGVRAVGSQVSAVVHHPGESHGSRHWGGGTLAAPPWEVI